MSVVTNKAGIPDDFLKIDDVVVQKVESLTLPGCLINAECDTIPQLQR